MNNKIIMIKKRINKEQTDNHEMNYEMKNDFKIRIILDMNKIKLNI